MLGINALIGATNPVGQQRQRKLTSDGSTLLGANDIKELQSQCIKEFSRRKLSGAHNVSGEEKPPGSPNGSLRSNKLLTNVSQFIKSPKLQVQNKQPPNIADLVEGLADKGKKNQSIFPHIGRDRLNSAFRQYKDKEPETSQVFKSPIIKAQEEPSFGANSNNQCQKEEDDDKKQDDL